MLLLQTVVSYVPWGIPMLICSRIGPYLRGTAWMAICGTGRYHGARKRIWYAESEGQVMRYISNLNNRCDQSLRAFTRGTPTATHVRLQWCGVMFLALRSGGRFAGGCGLSVPGAGHLDYRSRCKRSEGVSSSASGVLKSACEADRKVIQLTF